MKLWKRRIIRLGRVAAFALLTCIPLLSGCNSALSFSYMLDWGALIIFAPLRSIYGGVMLDIINTF